MNPSINTTIRGDVSQSREVSRSLERVGSALTRMVEDSSRAAKILEPNWQGPARDLGLFALAEHRDAAKVAVQKFGEVSRAIGKFAEELEQLKGEMHRIRGVAQSQAMVVTGDWIHTRVPGNAVEVLAGVKASHRILNMVADVRTRERTAHEKLARELVDFRSFADHVLDTKPAAMAVHVRSSAAVGVRNQFEYRDFLARVSGRAAMDGTAGSHEQLQAAKNLVTNQAAANRLAPANSVLNASVGPRLFKPSFTGGGLAVLGIGLAMSDGKPADQAIASGTASFAAGTLATGATAILLGAGPPGWIAIGVGAVVSTGVGYLVDHHWDTIKDAMTPADY